MSLFSLTFAGKYKRKTYFWETVFPSFYSLYLSCTHLRNLSLSYKNPSNPSHIHKNRQSYITPYVMNCQACFLRRIKEKSLILHKSGTFRRRLPQCPRCRYRYRNFPQFHVVARRRHGQSRHTPGKTYRTRQME